MFKVIAVVMGGLNIKGYQLEDIDTKESTRVLDKTMIDLIKKGDIQDVEIIEDCGEEFVVGLKLSNLMITSSGNIKIADKIYGDNGEVIGYKAVDLNKDREVNITSEKAWNLAVTNCVENGKASFKRNISDGSVTKYFQVEE